MADLSKRLARLSPADMMIVLRALLRGGGEGDLADRLETVRVSPGACAQAIANAFRLALED